MEDILEVYARPYNRKFPVVCMDESSVQLIGEVHEPIPAAPGHPVLVDDEYVRNGVASIFLEVEPLGGKRKVKITEQRTRRDWAHFIKEMLEERYADAEKVVLVMDNLNTHNMASLYTAFSPEEARCLADRLEIHYTPKHGSWLNIAEIELSVLKRQCLAGRIDCIEKMRAEVAAWNIDRNNRQTKVDWQSSIKWSSCYIKELKQIECSFAARSRLDMLLMDLEYARQQILFTHRTLKTFCKNNSEINEHMDYLQSIPGIGFITAISTLGAMGDPQNLRNPREIGAFVGLVPRENSTGDRINKGSITHLGNQKLRSLFIEASWVAIRKDNELQQFYYRIKKRHHPKIASRVAIVAVARKLTQRIYKVLKEKRKYIIH